jgi:molecular chaperone GrpE
VTSKEPTLAEKKKRKSKASGPDKDRETTNGPSNTGGSAETLSPEPEKDGGKRAEERAAHRLEPIELDLDTFEIDDEAVEPARKPSAKEVLNRLLEKNEIILKLNKDNAEKDKKLKDLNDKWLRSVAEFENYRKRSRKEWELLKLQSKAEVILEILNIIDDFERAFSVAEDADRDDFIRGIRLIYNNMLSVLDKFGVSEIDAHNSSFDPNFHMAVGQVETDEVNSGHVAEVIQKGYQLDDTVIRPARVIVAK